MGHPPMPASPQQNVNKRARVASPPSSGGASSDSSGAVRGKHFGLQNCGLQSQADRLALRKLRRANAVKPDVTAAAEPAQANPMGLLADASYQGIGMLQQAGAQQQQQQLPASAGTFALVNLSTGQVMRSNFQPRSKEGLQQWIDDDDYLTKYFSRAPAGYNPPLKHWGSLLVNNKGRPNPSFFCFLCEEVQPEFEAAAECARKGTTYVGKDLGNPICGAILSQGVLGRYSSKVSTLEKTNFVQDMVLCLMSNLFDEPSFDDFCANVSKKVSKSDLLVPFGWPRTAKTIDEFHQVVLIGRGALNAQTQRLFPGVKFLEIKVLVKKIFEECRSFSTMHGSDVQHGDLTNVNKLLCKHNLPELFLLIPFAGTSLWKSSALDKYTSLRQRLSDQKTLKKFTGEKSDCSLPHLILLYAELCIATEANSPQISTKEFVKAIAGLADDVRPFDRTAHAELRKVQEKDGTFGYQISKPAPKQAATTKGAGGGGGWTGSTNTSTTSATTGGASATAAPTATHTAAAAGAPTGYTPGAGRGTETGFAAALSFTRPGLAAAYCTEVETIRKNATICTLFCGGLCGFRLPGSDDVMYCKWGDKCERDNGGHPASTKYHTENFNATVDISQWTNPPAPAGKKGAGKKASKGDGKTKGEKGKKGGKHEQHPP
ncbi:unnamed protein product [Amoebophrya sp. A120]|nr:unnamed protein product [Amoebophrya sp. A120]|eukprot:GSA120T00007015001.1